MTKWKREIKLKHIQTVEEFNNEMDNVYNYCDDNKILIN